jgi:hypothetical protein
MENPKAIAPGRWIWAFMNHVRKEAPSAPDKPLAAAAAELYVRLGRFDPVDVAEAEWDILPLR